MILGLSKNKRTVPIAFKEVALCRTFGWSYWELMTQPAWFLERLTLYMEAEDVAGELISKKAELEAKIGRKLRR